jgi:hypothetical protein
MFRHQGATLTGFIQKKDCKYIYLVAGSTSLSYVFDIGMEAHVNMRRGRYEWLEQGDNAINPAGTNVCEIFLRAGEYIRNQEVFKVQLVSPGC